MPKPVAPEEMTDWDGNKVGSPEYNANKAANAPVIDDEMKAMLSAPLAKGWMPVPGDMVGGICVDRNTTHGDWEPYEVLEILQSNGETVAVHCFHTVLANQVERKNPQPGDKVGVAYIGKAETNSKGNPAELYRLVVVKQNAPQLPFPTAAPADPTIDEPF